MNLKAEQQKLYALMPADAHCFVRICDGDHALWVSDLPRRASAYGDVEKRLNDAGFRVYQDSQSSLWYIDWTEERWRQLFEGTPCELPAFLLKDENDELYALCRLYLLHPNALEKEHLPALRKGIKLKQMQPGQRERAVRQLHEEAACRLREGKSIAHATGRILAAWLNETENGKETQL